MGELDDAIREHLELKRAHGAAEDEVERQEHEALGPARREQPPEPEPQAEAAPAPEPVEAPAPEPQPAPEPEAPEPEPAPDPEPAAEPEPDRVPTGDTPTRGFDALEELPAEGDPPAGDGEDVLEETPEFLQETPEHDRLWFEQKPPRDFDFDE